VITLTADVMVKPVGSRSLINGSTSCSLNDPRGVVSVPAVHSLFDHTIADSHATVGMMSACVTTGAAWNIAVCRHLACDASVDV